MGILVTGDIHASDNPRDGYRFHWMDRFAALARKRQPTHIVVLGDLTEEKDRHSATLVNVVVDWLYQLTEVCPVFGLQGNHDYVADPSNGFWAFLSHITNLTWITQPLGIAVGDQEMLFLPHTRDHKLDWKGIYFENRDWIFAHNTFEGARTGHGYPLKGIPISVFPKNARVISGDIHEPQIVGPVTYVGAPYLCDFGDNYDPRVLWLDNNKVISLASPGAQKRLVDIRGPEELKLQNHIHKGDIVKVRVNLSMKERDRWPEVRKTVEAWAEDNGYILHACLPQFQLGATSRTTMSRLDKRSDKDTLKKYGAAHGINQAVLQTGLDLLEEE